MTRAEEITAHYVSQWGPLPTSLRWSEGPIADLPDTFCVLEFAPTKSRHMWTYATCSMSQVHDARQIELHLFSPIRSDLHVELLTAIAHFHRTGALLGLGHTVYFGRPWLDGSLCDYGLISWPYVENPLIQKCQVARQEDIVYFLWLIPITESEREFKIINGLEALEERLEMAKFDYLDPLRRSII